MSALQKALEDFRARQASVAANQLKDADKKARPLATLVSEAMRRHSACAGQGELCAVPCYCGEFTKEFTAADVTGAARQQKRPAPKREPKAGRGGRGGRGRGRAAAAEAAGAAAPDKAWQTVRLSRSGVPLAKQLKVLPGSCTAGRASWWCQHRAQHCSVSSFVSAEQPY